MSTFTPTHLWRVHVWADFTDPIPVEVIGDAWGGYVTVLAHTGATYLARRDELTPIEQEQS